MDEVTTKDVNTLLAELETVGGPKGLKLDPSGFCVVKAPKGPAITIMFRDPLPVLTILAPVTLSPDVPEDILHRFLLANGRWDITFGGAFAKPAPDQPIHYCQRMMLNGLTADACLSRLKAFAHMVEKLSNRIAADLGPSEPTPDLTGAKQDMV